MASISTNELIVYRLDIAFLCVVAVFFLAALPRTFARLLRRQTWTRGHMLLKGPVRNINRSRSTLIRATSSKRRPARHAYASEPGVEMDYVTDQSHTLVAHTNNNISLPKHSTSSIDESGSPPIHVPTLFTVFYPVSSVLARSFTRAITVAKLILLLLLVAACFTVAFILKDNPFQDSTRLGWLAAALIPFVVELGTKNNIFGWLTCLGYERLNFLHRWVGVSVFVVANLHAFLYIHKWTLNGIMSVMIKQQFVQYGIATLVGVELLFIGSLPYVRNQMYTLFMFSHITGIAMLLACLCFHQSSARYFVFGALGVYALDHIIRFLKTRITTAKIAIIPELSMTKVHIPVYKAGWRAGQHIRLRVISKEFGLLGWTIAHPFTVASASDTEGIVLLVKKAGMWTSDLYEAAGRAGYFNAESGKDAERDIKVIVEGPYGGLGNMMVASYSTTLLIGGGSGVSFILAVAEELAMDLRKRKSSMRFLEVIWVTQDRPSIAPLVPSFNLIMESVGSLPGLVTHITVYYSRASPAESSGRTLLDSSLAPGLTIRAGRPGIKKTLDILCRETQSIHNPRGIAVGVCGPEELIDDVREVSRSIDTRTRRACGGVEVHEEFFGW